MVMSDGIFSNGTNYSLSKVESQQLRTNTAIKRKFCHSWAKFGGRNLQGWQGVRIFDRNLRWKHLFWRYVHLGLDCKITTLTRPSYRKSAHHVMGILNALLEFK